MTQIDETRVRTAWAQAQYGRATELMLEAYGPQILRYLTAKLRSRSRAEDAYGIWQMNLFIALPAFRWEAKARTYAYKIARGAVSRYLSLERKYADLPEELLSGLVARVDTRTAPYLKTSFKDAIRELQQRFAPQDQELLRLRVVDRMPYNEIAKRLLGADATQSELRAKAVSLRAKFKSLRERLARWAREDGLI
jgi:RNA polymerase sigma factor (sigma-70 family)